MKYRFLSILVALSLLVAFAPVMAQSMPDRPKAPPYPMGIADVHEEPLFLGMKIDPQSTQLVEGYAFIHRVDAPAHRSLRSRPREPSSACYAYLAQGAKWKTVEPWVMNPANAAGLDTAAVFTLEADGIAKWEDAADGTVGSGPGFNIIGAGSTTTETLIADQGSPDGQNEVYFADVASPGAIAVTIVWGVFSGPTSQRRLVEWDQVYDDVDYDWSLTGAPGLMDFDDIATHEIGHAAGMGHPSNSCTEETMYAFASYGETKKRDLNLGDITGINRFY